MEIRTDGIRSGKATIVKLAASLNEAIDMLEQYYSYAESMREIGRGHYPTSISGCTPRYFIDSLKAELEEIK